MQFLVWTLTVPLAQMASLAFFIANVGILSLRISYLRYKILCLVYPCLASSVVLLWSSCQRNRTLHHSVSFDLCNFLNKIFTRVLRDRLSSLLPKLISEEQTGFLKGRDIADNILLAQELLQSLNRRARSHNVVFKFDMAKAFDRVSWLF